MKKKYLTLSVRASYQPQDDTIHLTTKDAGKKNIHLTLNRHSESEETIRNQMIEAGLIQPAQAGIPSMAVYPFGNARPWHQFPLGVTRGNREVVWDVLREPHMLLGGPTGSGKSVIQRAIIAHTLENPEWNFVGIDLKRVELSVYKRYTNTVKTVATELETAVAALIQVQAAMNERYEVMQTRGVMDYLSLRDEHGNRPKSILVMIDEAFVVLAPEGYRGEGGKERDMLHGEAARLVQNIALLGRAAGIHLVIATQRPDAAVVPEVARDKFDMRVAAGRMSSIPSALLVDSNAAVDLPRIKGRGLIVASGEAEETQFYYASPQALDERFYPLAAV